MASAHGIWGNDCYILLYCIIYIYIYYLVGGDWNMNGFYFIFPSIGNVIIPTDEFIFFRGVGIPPTRCSLVMIFTANQR